MKNVDIYDNVADLVDGIPYVFDSIGLFCLNILFNILTICNDQTKKYNPFSERCV